MPRSLRIARSGRDPPQVDPVEVGAEQLHSVRVQHAGELMAVWPPTAPPRLRLLAVDDVEHVLFGEGSK